MAHKQTHAPTTLSPLSTVRRGAFDCCGLPKNFMALLTETDFSEFQAQNDRMNSVVFMLYFGVILNHTSTRFEIKGNDSFLNSYFELRMTSVNCVLYRVANLGEVRGF